MNYQVSEYRNLTSSIKTWMQECRSPSKKSSFHSILSAYRAGKKEIHNGVPEITIDELIDAKLKSLENKLARAELEGDCPKLCKKHEAFIQRESINEFDTLDTTIFSEGELSFQTALLSDITDLSFKTANESIYVEEQKYVIPERNYAKYPEKIRRQIEFFENNLTFKSNYSKKPKKVTDPKPTMGSPRECVSHLEVILKQAKKSLPKLDLLTHLEEEVKEKLPPTHSFRPVITHTIMKEQVLAQLMAIHEQAEVRDEVRDLHLYQAILPFDQPWEFEAIGCKAIPPSPEEEKFVVNLYEPKTSPTKKLNPDFHGAITKINTKLYIKGNQTPPEPKYDTSDSESSSSKTCIVKNAAPSQDSEKSFDLESSISALLDKTESSVDVSLDESLPSGTGNLEEEVHNQCRIMQEATKAVEICNIVKELAGGQEQLEAERVLLLAGLKRSLLIKKLREVEYGGLQQRNGRTSLTLSDMEFPLMLPENHHDYQIWYIITCSCESTLQASQLIPRQRYCHYLNFPASFTFGNVDPSSMVNLKVYQVKIRNNSKRRIAKLCCIAPANVCSRISQKVQYKDVYSGMVVESEILSSIFTLCGSLEIPVERLINKKNFLLDPTPNDTTLFGSLKLASEISNFAVNLNHDGFLTIGIEEKDNVAWDRKWCRLIGTTMQFWDHPSEEGLKAPEIVVELKNSMDDEVTDEYVSRRRILLLRIANSKDEESLVMTKYFLANDSNKDLKIWKKHVNSVLTSLRLWKCFDL